MWYNTQNVYDLPLLTKVLRLFQSILASITNSFLQEEVMKKREFGTLLIIAIIIIGTFFVVVNYRSYKSERVLGIVTELTYNLPESSFYHKHSSWLSKDGYAIDTVPEQYIITVKVDVPRKKDGKIIYESVEVLFENRYYFFELDEFSKVWVIYRVEKNLFGEITAEYFKLFSSVVDNETFMQDL